MRLNKNLIIFALIALMVVCVSAVSAQDSSNITLEDTDGEAVAIDEISEVSQTQSDEEVTDVSQTDSSEEVLCDGQDDYIYVDGNYMGEDERGTKEKPYASISKAVAGTTVNKSNIFVKNGEYEISSQISLPSDHGFSIVGESSDNVIIRGSGSYVYMFRGNLNNYDMSLSNLTFTNVYNSYALNIGGTGNLNIDGCVFSNFNTYTSSNSAFIISTTASTMKNTKITDLTSKNSNGPSFIVYQSGTHTIEDTIIDKFASTNSLKGGVMSVNANANVQAVNLTISNINAAVNLGLVQVSGKFSARNSSFKNNVLKTGSSVSAVYSLFYVNNGVLTIDKSEISHNSGFNYLIQENGANAVSNVTYTAIIGNDAKVNLLQISGLGNLNYNWWGTNEKPNDYVDNWVLMNFSFVKNVNKVSISADFTKYSDGSSTYDLDKDMNFAIHVTSSHGTVDRDVDVKDNVAAIEFTSNGDFYVDVDTGSKVTLPIGFYYVDSSFDGEELGTQDNPFKTIYNAVSKTTGWETIYIKNGNYTEDKLITLTNSLNFIGESKGGVIISGSNKGSFNNPFYMSKQLTLSFTNLTFADISCSGDNAVLSLGKSVAELTISDCIFDNCTGRWGALNIEGPNLTMMNCQISNSKSTAEGVGTAAVHINGAGTYEIKNTIIDNSQCIGTYAQGIIVSDDDEASLTLDNVEIINNNIAALSLVSGGKLTVKNSKIQNNTLFTGGASLLHITAESTVQTTSFIDNIVPNVILVEGANATVQGTIEGNVAENIFSAVKNSDVKINGLSVCENVMLNVIDVEDSSQVETNELYVFENSVFTVFKLGENTILNVNGGYIQDNDVDAIFNAEMDSTLVVDSVSIINNNITNVIINSNANMDIENSIISNNNCSEEFISNLEDNSNITLNYNIILDNNEKSIANKLGVYNLNYNWWGTNDKPNEYADCWVILDATVSRSKGVATVDVYINKYVNGSDVMPLARNLPDGLKVNVNSSSGAYSTALTIGRGTARCTFTISENDEFVFISSSNANITVSLSPKTVYVDGSFEGEGTGDAESPYTTVQEAIDNANDQDTIFIKEGTYSEKITWTGGKGLHIFGQNNKVVLNLSEGSTITPNVLKLSLVNLTFMGNKNNINLVISGNGELNIINTTFDTFTISNVFLNIANSNSNIVNSKFLNIEQARGARQLGLIATYTGTGNHVIKDTVMDNIIHEAQSRLYYSWGVLYINTASAIVDIDNLTMSRVYSISESLIRTNGVLNIKNSKFIDNNVRKFQQGARYYVGTSLFYNNNGKLNIEGTLIENNTGSTYLIYHNGGNSVSNINYNAIYANTFSTGIATTTGTNNLDYNWWNASTPAYDKANAWIVLDAYYTPERIISGDSIDVVATFNHYITKDGAYGDTKHVIPFDSEVTFVLPNGSTVNATTKNGEASFVYTTNQSENITVLGSGQEKVLQIVFSTFRIDVPENIVVGQDATIKVLAPGIDTNMTLFVNGKSETIEVVNGSGSKTIENINAGTYTVVAVFNGDSTHEFDFDSKTFEVEKIETQINAEDVSINVGETASININLGENVTGRIYFDLSGKKSFDYLVNGQITFDIKDLAMGNYSLSISYEGNDKYSASEKTVNVFINGFDSGLKAHVSDIKVGEDAVVAIEISKDVSGAVVVIVDKEYPVTLTDGKASVKVSDLVSGTYNVVVKFAGDAKFKAAEVNLTLVVSKVDAYDKFSLDITIPEGTTSPEYTINLPSDATGNFTVTVDGNNYTAALVNGSATVKVENLTPGEHNISFLYTGDAKYPGFIFQTQSETIPKASISGGDSALNPTTPEGSANPSYSINLPSDATGNLTVTVDGTDTYTQALVNGSATVNVPKLSSGKHNIVVTYTGDNKYSSISKNSTVTVPEPVVKLSGNKNINMLYSAGTAYKVLVTVDGKAAAGVKVTFKFNGKTKKVTTDKKGYATYKIPTVKPKKYTITATYSGKTVKNTVKVTTVIKAKNLKASKSKALKLKVTLKKVNKKVLKGKTLKLKLNGKTIKAKTNKKGVATFKVAKKVMKKLKVGKKYAYKVTYGKDTVSKKLTIKK